MCVKTGGGRYMLTCSTPPVLADWTHVRLQLHAHAGHGHTSYYMKHVYGCKLQHHGRGAMPAAVALPQVEAMLECCTIDEDEAGRERGDPRLAGVVVGDRVAQRESSRRRVPVARRRGT